MCPHCKQLSCTNCLSSYLYTHDTCFNCKNKITLNEMPNAPLDEEHQTTIKD